MDTVITEERIIDCQSGSWRLHLGS
jgi:hypothetical protein